jgi:rod shape-determining protein MreC
MKTSILKYVIILLLLTIIIFKENLYYCLGLIVIPKPDSIEIAFNETLKQEYEEILKTMSLPNKYSFEYSYSKVLYKNYYAINDNITIYHGKDFGYKEKMAVINDNGLVGIIDQVFASSSTVKLLTSTDLQLSVIVNNNYGLLTYNGKDFIIVGLNENDDIDSDMEVYTSGIGYIMGGIKIGKVLFTKSINNEKQAYIKPYVDFKKINYFIVIKDML